VFEVFLFHLNKAEVIFVSFVVIPFSKKWKLYFFTTFPELQLKKWILKKISFYFKNYTSL